MPHHPLILLVAEAGSGDVCMGRGHIFAASGMQILSMAAMCCADGGLIRRGSYPVRAFAQPRPDFADQGKHSVRTNNRSDE